MRRAATHGAYEYTTVKEGKDGPRHIASRLSGIFDEQETLIGYAHFSQDVSARVQTEAQLLARSISAAQQAHNEVREFILGMKKPAAAADFWTALQRYAQTFEAQRRIPVLLSLPADNPRWLTPPRDLHLLRIIQEALTNVYKHAAATQVQIIATQIAPDKAQFIISDNGRGFDPLPNPLPKGEETTSSPFGGGLRWGSESPSPHPPVSTSA